MARQNEDAGRAFLVPIASEYIDTVFRTVFSGQEISLSQENRAELCEAILHSSSLLQRAILNNTNALITGESETLRTGMRAVTDGLREQASFIERASSAGTTFLFRESIAPSVPRMRGVCDPLIDRLTAEQERVRGLLQTNIGITEVLQHRLHAVEGLKNLAIQTRDGTDEDLGLYPGTPEDIRALAYRLHMDTQDFTLGLCLNIELAIRHIQMRIPGSPFSRSDFEDFPAAFALARMTLGQTTSLPEIKGQIETLLGQLEGRQLVNALQEYHVRRSQPQQGQDVTTAASPPSTPVITHPAGPNQDSGHGPPP